MFDLIFLILAGNEDNQQSLDEFGIWPHLAIDYVMDLAAVLRLTNRCWDRSASSVAWSTGAQLMIFFCFRFSVVLWTRDLHPSCNRLYVLSLRLCFFVVSIRDLCVYHDDSWTIWRVIMRTEQPTQCFVPLQKLRFEIGAVKLVYRPPLIHY